MFRSLHNSKQCANIDRPSQFSLPPGAEQTAEESVELLVARTFTDKQETLAAGTRVMKTHGEAGAGHKEPKEGFPGLGSS